MGSRILFVAVGAAFLMGVAASRGQGLPPGLAEAALASYPQAILWDIAGGGAEVFPEVPITEDVARGWIKARTEKLAADGPEVAVVVYCRYRRGALERVFVRDADVWRPARFRGTTSFTMGDWEVRIDPEEQIVFEDLDRDGVKELVLYWRSCGGHQCKSGVLAFALHEGELVPLTETKFDPPVPGREHEGCRLEEGHLTSAAAFESESGVGFVDIDADGVAELLVYPAKREETDPANGVKYYVAATGTRVFRLSNGTYRLQFETPIGTSGMPAIGAAMKPASVPASELEGVATGSGGGNDQALSLFVMPPANLMLEAVEWSDFRVGNLRVQPTTTHGVSPAPHRSDEQTTWAALNHMGQAVWLEDLAGTDWGKFKQDQRDPCVFVGPSGCLHMTTPFRELRFSKKAVFTWLWDRWQKGAANTALKSCLPEGSHQRCFTPIDLPIKVNLKNGHGFALGAAQLWVETTE